ncbi:MAG TPA: outer membrane beta-barrel protein [Burkholderiales bacterium]|nr:outer membrane beta-barrel protein [Burkholderiales bacterium]
MTSRLSKWLALALTFIAAPALAQATKFPPPPPPTMVGPYAGGTIGYAQAKDGCLGVLSVGGRTCDDKDLSYGVFAGYRLLRYLAAEAAYKDLGKVTATGPGSTETIHGTVWDVTALGILPIDDQISAYLRIGAYRATLDASARGADATSNGNITYGAGLQWDLPSLFNVRNLSVRLDWQRYKKVGAADTLYGVNIYDVSSIGVMWRFR